MAISTDAFTGRVSCSRPVSRARREGPGRLLGGDVGVGAAGADRRNDASGRACPRRSREPIPWPTLSVARVVVPMVHLVMERKQLLDIAERAEAAAARSRA